MQPQVYGFAFAGNISAQVLDRLSVEYRYLLTGTESITHMMADLSKKQPPLILGLGMYSGRDKDAMRLETLCTNNFRHRPQPTIQLEIHPFLNPGEGFKPARGIGNSWCNLSAYQVMQAIAEGRLRARFSFVHIPKTYNEDLVAARLANQLEGLRL